MFIEEHVSQFIKVQLRTYAHNVYNRLLITELDIINLGISPLHVALTRHNGSSSNDVNFNTTDEKGFRY